MLANFNHVVIPQGGGPELKLDLDPPKAIEYRPYGATARLVSVRRLFPGSLCLFVPDKLSRVHGYPVKTVYHKSSSRAAHRPPALRRRW